MVNRHGMIGMIGTSASTLDIMGTVATIAAATLTAIYMAIFIYRELRGRKSGKHDPKG